MLDKPPVGAPCNGCGLCCQVEVCSAGSMTLGLVSAYGERAPGPCPALVRQGDAFACGMVLRPRDYAPGRGGAHQLREAAKILVGAGVGCDEGDGSPEDEAAVMSLQQTYLEKVGRSAIQRAVSTWYGVD